MSEYLLGHSKKEYANSFIFSSYMTSPSSTAVEQEHMFLLDNCLQTYMTYTIAECTVNKLLMIDRRTVRNM
jgi:hypothetical protein